MKGPRAYELRPFLCLDSAMGMAGDIGKPRDVKIVSKV